MYSNLSKIRLISVSKLFQKFQTFFHYDRSIIKTNWFHRETDTICYIFLEIEYRLEIPTQYVRYTWSVLFFDFHYRGINQPRLLRLFANWKNLFLGDLMECREAAFTNSHAKQRRWLKKTITCWTIRINDPFVAFNVGTGPVHLYQF